MVVRYIRKIKLITAIRCAGYPITVEEFQQLLVNGGSVLSCGITNAKYYNREHAASIVRVEFASDADTTMFILRSPKAEFISLSAVKTIIKYSKRHARMIATNNING